MTGQTPLTEEQQNKILQILKELNIDTKPWCQEEDDKGVMQPIHKDVYIRVCSYDDEGERFNMYVNED